MNLEERLAHLQWRKVCNQSQIKGALKQSKQLAEKDTLLNATECRDRTSRVKSIVQSEMARPLEVPLALVEAMQRDMDNENQSLERTSAIHVHSVTSIQAKIRQREDQAKRHKTFRKHKAALLASFSPNGSTITSPPSRGGQQRSQDETATVTESSPSLVLKGCLMPTNFYASMHPPCRLVALPPVDWTSHAHLAMTMSEAMMPYAAVGSSILVAPLADIRRMRQAKHTYAVAANPTSFFYAL
ncbi:hypothetical protein DYB38_001023 [Aphanomyces astaci]|uniref:Uncharacterized protein n=1 Tax=Aphanomyces astaci TaxID=112090 RepID=A0A397CR67_APHAT|nr:hypothetical protein DYB38_001023 [Aphanomyces astaci]RHY57786.1 hypothetical protein DYB34_002226 [Aphanomyces astaci]